MFSLLSLHNFLIGQWLFYAVHKCDWYDCMWKFCLRRSFWCLNLLLLQWGIWLNRKLVKSFLKEKTYIKCIWRFICKHPTGSHKAAYIIKAYQKVVNHMSNLRQQEESKQYILTEEKVWHSGMVRDQLAQETSFTEIYIHTHKTNYILPI
jgi:hypothetical protein